MNTYISQSNQKLLWKTMLRSPLFQRKQQKEEWFKGIIGSFYESNKANSGISLKEINMNTVNYMIKSLHDEFSAMGINPGAAPSPMMMSQPTPIQPISMASQMSINSHPASAQYSRVVVPPMPPSAINVPHTSQDLQNIKRNEFDTKLEQAKLEHQSLLQKELPPHIDFRDKVAEDTPIANMSELIQIEIEKRNMDINTFAKSGIKPVAAGATQPQHYIPTMENVANAAIAAARKNVSWKDSLVENTMTPSPTSGMVPLAAPVSAKNVIEMPADYIAKLTEIIEMNNKRIIELVDETQKLREEIKLLKEEDLELKNIIKTIVGLPQTPETTVDVPDIVKNNNPIDADKVIDDVLTKLEQIYNNPMGENAQGENEMIQTDVPPSAESGADEEHTVVTEQETPSETNIVLELKQTMDNIDSAENNTTEPELPEPEPEVIIPTSSNVVNLSEPPPPHPQTAELARRRRR